MSALTLQSTVLKVYGYCLLVWLLKWNKIEEIWKYLNETPIFQCAQ